MTGPLPENQAQPAPPEPPKKQYQTPVLTVHGRVDQITKMLLKISQP